MCFSNRVTPRAKELLPQELADNGWESLCVDLHARWPTLRDTFSQQLSMATTSTVTIERKDAGTAYDVRLPSFLLSRYLQGVTSANHLPPSH